MSTGRARESIGGPIAHGYLSLSLVAAMVMELGMIPPDAVTGLNYGLDKVRFIVPVGGRTRAHPREPDLGRAAKWRSNAVKLNARWRSMARQNRRWSPRCCAC